VGEGVGVEPEFLVEVGAVEVVLGVSGALVQEVVHELGFLDVVLVEGVRDD